MRPSDKEVPGEQMCLEQQAEVQRIRRDLISDPVAAASPAILRLPRANVFVPTVRVVIVITSSETTQPDWLKLNHVTQDINKYWLCSIIIITRLASHYYAPPLIGGGIKRCFCLTSVCRVHRALWLVVLAVQHGHTVIVTYPYAYMTYIVTSCRPGRGYIVAAARLQLVM